MIIPDYVLTDQELWTPILVRDAMVRAMKVMRAIPMRVGHAPLKGYWPEITSTDEWPENSDRFRPNKDDITKAEIVLVGYRDKDGHPHPAWLNGALLGYPPQRRILSKWTAWASFGKTTFDGICQTEDEFARGLGLSHATLKRHIDFSAGLIAQGLNSTELSVWHVERPQRRKNRQAVSSA